MLLGAKCAHVHQKSEETARATNEAARGGGLPVAKATAVVRRLAFVGLQERWADSICLFHAALGGAPRKIEFVDAHSRRRRGRDAPLVPAPYDEGGSTVLLMRRTRPCTPRRRASSRRTCGGSRRTDGS